jgi:hypothetical protein
MFSARFGTMQQSIGARHRIQNNFAKVLCSAEVAGEEVNLERGE